MKRSSSLNGVGRTGPALKWDSGKTPSTLQWAQQAQARERRVPTAPCREQPPQRSSQGPEHRPSSSPCPAAGAGASLLHRENSPERQRSEWEQETMPVVEWPPPVRVSAGRDASGSRRGVTATESAGLWKAPRRETGALAGAVAGGELPRGWGSCGGHCGRLRRGGDRGSSGGFDGVGAAETVGMRGGLRRGGGEGEEEEEDSRAARGRMRVGRVGVEVVGKAVREKGEGYKTDWRGGRVWGPLACEGSEALLASFVASREAVLSLGAEALQREDGSRLIPAKERRGLNSKRRDCGDKEVKIAIYN
ncbi:uncharacterized protein A4U43_C03F21590 [Asparagus officinalis]|uniref:Uncharacterized protein n=1 Tax=Asparagus officinalis TaxID=4686 RepID=A0A5P1FCW0_ASPOF|nr:uncharacterized protein A4U43_C03F21590 [Asparagus officinalis]